MKLHLPHISRIFSAKTISLIGNLCLWVLLAAVISLNVLQWRTRPLAYSDSLMEVFVHPFSAIAHENLAIALWNSGARALANREFAIVEELSPVLGASTTANAKREEADMRYWQDTLSSHPDYRDAYIQLAALLYRRGNLAQSNAYLVQAQALDPNNATVNSLVNFTSKFLE